MAKKITMQLIADRAGVSKFAVSKALAGQSGVSEDTRERILRTATQLGYFTQKRVQQKYSKEVRPQGVPHHFNKTSMMVLMPNIRMQNTDSHYWGKIIDGIADALRQYNLSMMIVTEHTTTNVLNVVHLDEMVGLIGVGTISTPMLVELVKFEIPSVLVDYEDPTVPSDTVFFNNYDGAVRMTNHLISQGHVKLQFVGDVHYAPSFHDRWVAFRTTLEDHGLELDQEERLLGLSGVVGPEHMSVIREVAGDWELKGSWPTALVCANDEIAMTAMRALQDSGFSIPTDISVTGFDNIEDSLDTVPPLTTVNVDKEMLGRRAVEMLFRRLDHPNYPVEKILMTGNLIFRESTGPAPQ